MIRANNSITIEDVARAAGVSRAAVSKVIRDAYGVSGEMKAKVEATIEELGYRPRVSARAMRGATYTFGIEIPTIKNPFFTKIISGAASALEGTRYQLIIAPAGPHANRGPQAIQVLADRQVDGILAVSTAVDPAWLEELSQGIPLVMLGRHDDSQNYDTLVNDDVEGARLAVQHLYDLGHRDIVHLTIAATDRRWLGWASRTGYESNTCPPMRAGVGRPRWRSSGTRLDPPPFSPATTRSPSECWRQSQSSGSRHQRSPWWATTTPRSPPILWCP
jgi:DNA-binding LacI/PurR family transcriptional regulator